MREVEETTTIQIYASDGGRLKSILEDLRREFAVKHGGKIRLIGPGANGPNHADAFRHVLDSLDDSEGSS